MKTLQHVLNESINEADEKWCVILLGGSIGSGSRVQTPYESGLDKEGAQNSAKRRNKQLSPGEKSYYRMKYIAVKETDLGKGKYFNYALNESLNEANVVTGKTLLDFLKWYTNSKDPLKNKSAMKDVFDNGGFDTYKNVNTMIASFEANKNKKITVKNNEKYGEVSFALEGNNGNNFIILNSTELYESLNESNVVTGKTLLDFLKWYTFESNPLSKRDYMKDLFYNGGGDTYRNIDQMINEFTRYQNEIIKVVNSEDEDALSFRLNGKTIVINITRIYK